MSQPIETAVLHEELRTIIQIARDGVELFVQDAGDVAQRGAILASIQTQLRTAAARLDALRSAGQAPAHEAPIPRACDLVAQTQYLMHALDPLLRERRLRHQLTIGSPLPSVVGAVEPITTVLSDLLSYLIQLAQPDSHITVHIREVELRQGNGLEWRVVASCPDFTEADRYRLFEVLGGVPPHLDPAVSGRDAHWQRLHASRAFVAALFGEVWAELPTPGQLALNLTLPAVTPMAAPAAITRYKFDVVIRDYPAVREELGAEAVQQILQAVEIVARNSVRAPRDSVTRYEPRGVVSVLCALPRGSADVVTQRITTAIQQFRATLGVTPIWFDFHLVPLP